MKSQLTRVFLSRQAWQPFDGLPQYTIVNQGSLNIYVGIGVMFFG